MEQDERAVVGLSEGSTEQGGEGTAPATAEVLAGEVAKEGVSEVDGSVHDAASESAKKQDLEEPSPESGEVAAASGSIENEDREACKNSIAIAAPFELRAASVDATPPSTSLRASSRDREQAVLTSFTAAGDAEPAGSEAADLGASSSAAPAAGSHEDVPAMENGDQGAALRRACSAPGTKTKVAIAHASPRDSYRRVPWRSRKQHSPKRFIPMAGASPLAASSPARDPAPQTASPGSGLPSASASGTPDASDDTASSSSSSSSTGRRPPSRRRKQLRTEHFVRDEATASAKARRSDIVLDRFLSCLVRRCPASRSEWVRNVTADDS